MSKAQRNRQQNARERIAAQQAAARRAERRRKMLWFGGAVVAVIAVVVALVVVKLSSSNSPGKDTASGGVNGTALPVSVNTAVKNVPVSALDAVGVGAVASAVPQYLYPISGATLTSAGKPEMLYIGAEYCPYCAAMRWSMAVALSRFGTLSPLHGIHSSTVDVDPSTATLTFYKSGYTSKYLTFTPIENETVTKKLLQNPTSAQQALWSKYEHPAGSLGYPFIDFGNKYVITGPLYDPAVLKGLTWQQIAADLKDPSSTVAQNVLGAANVITAAICKTTGGQPGSVCTAKGVTAAASHLS